MSLIDREKTLERLLAMADQTDTITTESVEYVLESEPTAQPEIIACGDCKHWICHDRRCGYWNHGVKPLEWCCHAERREDGQNT